MRTRVLFILVFLLWRDLRELGLLEFKVTSMRSLVLPSKLVFIRQESIIRKLQIPLLVSWPCVSSQISILGGD